MVPLNNVLVASDFDQVSEAALSYGRELARTFGATLHVLHVSENAFLVPAFGDPSFIKVAALKRLNERLTEEDRRALHARVVMETSDNPSDTIVEYAKSAAIDMIVVGTHGRTGLDHLLTSSVAEHVVRNAPCPVLIVKNPQREVMTMNSILVPIDFSEMSDAALKYAADMAQVFGARLYLLHVPGKTGENFEANFPVGRVETAAEARLRTLLSPEALERLRPEYASRIGTPAEEIVRYADARNPLCQ